MEEQEALLQKIYDRVKNYLRENEDEKVPVIDYHTPASLRRKINASIDEEGVDGTELLKLVDDYLKYSVRTGKVNFFNQLFSGFSTPGYIGDVIAAATNTSMYTYEVAPMATLIEQEVLKTMLTKIGFENGGGTFVTGGSNANLVALYAARQAISRGTQDKGLYGETPLAFYVSKEAHYSFEKAAMVLGLGQEAIWKVSVDDKGRMDAVALKDAIEKSIQQGRKPFFVGATAGTTVKGSFDSLPVMYSICREYNLWFHVDAAWGGGALLSKKHRQLLQGCELADSFAWDAHKMMGLPLICSVLLVKDKNLLARINRIQGGEYLFHDNAEEETDSCDLGHYSLQCGRKVEALKLWLAWKYYGQQGLKKKSMLFCACSICQGLHHQRRSL